MTDSVYNSDFGSAQDLGTLAPSGTTGVPGGSAFSSINRSDTVGVTGADAYDFFSFTPYHSGSAEVSFNFSPLQGGVSDYLEMFVLVPIQGVENITGPVLVYNISAGYSQYLDDYLPQIEAALGTEGYDESHIAFNTGTYTFDQTWGFTGEEVIFGATGIELGDNGAGSYVNPELSYNFQIDAVAGGGGGTPQDPDGPEIDGAYAYFDDDETNQVIDDTDLIDVFRTTGAQGDYSISQAGDGTITISGPMGVDHLMPGVERIEFSDATLAFDTDDNAGEGYRIYQAAFDRTPDTGGLTYWVHRLDDGASLHDLAQAFIGSDEFQGLYGTNPSNEAYVDLLYENVLNRTPDDGGYAYWTGQMDNGLTPADMLIAFSESAENQTNVAAAIDGGIWLA